ncbi:MAG: imidazole glycerol phosphate synthase subunit HisH [Euryarchaeota archaeon]|nr:imidazole glycerol phosphate synthase subunit HisH [Euryarchaeota archaeon]MBU4607199.1 imidazole glycerol phosphate synthase subunit HisH [Euryarchaeota archaeon]MBV1729488.1 imidazole glycerol phosphate synthase subunit HisH [Methanobacterium sp.]MBV1755229.1 imidazole glycerol phosphate synthase subunit HisH [Methanobacterium sp.]
MISIIDYGSGNLKSIKNGFSKIGVDSLVTDNAGMIKDAEALVLPGVGAFGAAMGNLHKYQDLIFEHIELGKPFLGVCLGLQLLFSHSQESSKIQGLNIFPGEVVRLPPDNKIPHMGWNQLKIIKNCPILEGIGSEYVYFVHSYYVVPENNDVVAAVAEYGIDVPAVLCRDNVYATQFHPEKSGKSGLDILKNFVKLVE